MSDDVGWWNTGDTVGIQLDLDKLTLKFTRNDQIVFEKENLEKRVYYAFLNTCSDKRNKFKWVYPDSLKGKETLVN